MRIVSKFKDYYDGFCASMRDEITFIRGETRELDEVRGGIWCEHRPYMIKFCDSFFPCINIRVYKSYRVIRNLWTYDENHNPTLFKNLKNMKIKWPDVPIAVAHVSGYNHRITIAPKLSDYGFGSILSPEQAYQELYRWLCNKPVEAKKIPHINNDMRILTHGFDKFSFRKDKENDLR